MSGHGHDFGHEFVSKADSDTETRFFGNSDTDSGTDMGISENLGHGLGQGQTLDTCVRSSLV